MVFQTSYTNEPSERLVEYLETAGDQGAIQLRRRAVLTRSTDGGWALVCCTVEALQPNAEKSEVIPPRHYEQVVLYEDRFTTEDCRQFIGEVQSGHATFGDLTFERDGNAQWSSELVPLENIYMPCAGHVVQARFAKKSNWSSQGPLLAQNEPYYSDLSEAARDWLPLIVYHGENDARNQQIIFLLPESRAFFSNAVSSNGTLVLSVDGTETERLPLMVKGAYWEDKTVTSFDVAVKNGLAKFAVPDEVERLEYVLLDSNGVIYDFQREDRFNHSGLGRRRLNEVDHDLAQQVKTACLDGEGPQIEFKPFIDCAQGMGSKTKKTKFRELVTTVVAFANTQGGRIYIGIDDECGVSGVAQELQQWAKAELEEAADRYRGALTSRIRDQVIGDVAMRVSHVVVDDGVVVIVDVSQSPLKPASVRADNIFYVRAGASNKQLPPDQWESVLTPKNSDGLFPHSIG